MADGWRWPVRRALVVGPSMAPTLRHGDQLVVRATSGPPAPGDIVVVQLPDRALSVKRVARLDGDDAVWVEGDNSFGSTDSRDVGPLPADAVVARVLFRLWPRPGRVRRR